MTDLWSPDDLDQVREMAADAMPLEVSVRAEGRWESDGTTDTYQPGALLYHGRARLDPLSRAAGQPVDAAGAAITTTIYGGAIPWQDPDSAARFHRRDQVIVHTFDVIGVSEVWVRSWRPGVTALTFEAVRHRTELEKS